MHFRAGLGLGLAALLAAGCSEKSGTPDGGVGEVLGLKVADAAARSCELVLGDADGAVLDLQFGSGVEGRFLREGTRLATAFVSKTDAVPANADLALRLKSGATSANLLVVSSRCFDRAGQPLAGATVEVVK